MDELPTVGEQAHLAPSRCVRTNPCKTREQVIGSPADKQMEGEALGEGQKPLEKGVNCVGMLSREEGPKGRRAVCHMAPGLADTSDRFV